MDQVTLGSLIESASVGPWVAERNGVELGGEGDLRPPEKKIGCLGSTSICGIPRDWRWSKQRGSCKQAVKITWKTGKRAKNYLPESPWPIDPW